MSNAFRYQLSIVLNLCLACLFLLTLAVLIEERSRDKIQFKVSSAEVYSEGFAPTLYELQALTGKEPIAIPLNGDNVSATRWQVRFE